MERKKEDCVINDAILCVLHGKGEKEKQNIWKFLPTE